MLQDYEGTVLFKRIRILYCFQESGNNFRPIFWTVEPKNHVRIASKRSYGFVNWLYLAILAISAAICTAI